MKASVVPAEADTEEERQPPCAKVTVYGSHNYLPGDRWTFFITTVLQFFSVFPEVYTGPRPGRHIISHHQTGQDRTGTSPANYQTNESHHIGPGQASTDLPPGPM